MARWPQATTVRTVDSTFEIYALVIEVDHHQLVDKVPARSRQRQRCRPPSCTLSSARSTSAAWDDSTRCRRTSGGHSRRCARPVRAEGIRRDSWPTTLNCSACSARTVGWRLRAGPPHRPRGEHAVATTATAGDRRLHGFRRDHPRRHFVLPVLRDDVVQHCSGKRTGAGAAGAVAAVVQDRVEDAYPGSGRAPTLAPR